MTAASGCFIPSPYHPFIPILPFSFLSLPISSFIPFFSLSFLSFTFTYPQRVLRRYILLCLLFAMFADSLPFIFLPPPSTTCSTHLQTSAYLYYHFYRKVYVTGNHSLYMQSWIIRVSLCQCCGSMTFLYGFGSADPWLWPIDPDLDPDPAIFVLDLQYASETLITFWRYINIIFLRKKSHKDSTKQKESRFFLLFLLDDRRIRICTSN